MGLPLRRYSAFDARADVGAIDFEAGDDVPRKGRARRFREARELKQGYDDGLFSDGGKTLADVDDDEAGTVHLADDEDRSEPEPWDPDEERNRRD